jgi:hypothetical protein
MVPVLAIYGVDAPKGELPKSIEKPMGIEELLAACEANNDTKAFDAFLANFNPLIGRINKVFITYRGYTLMDGLMLDCKPLVRPDLVVVPLGPAIMAQLGLKGGVLIDDIKGDMLKSNLLKYDIITAVNGAEVADTGGFYKALAACPPDKEAEFKIIRNGKATSIRGIIAAILAPKPPVPPEPLEPPNLPPPPPPPPDKP